MAPNRDYERRGHHRGGDSHSMRATAGSSRSSSNSRPVSEQEMGDYSGEAHSARNEHTNSYWDRIAAQEYNPNLYQSWAADDSSADRYSPLANLNAVPGYGSTSALSSASRESDQRSPSSSAQNAYSNTQSRTGGSRARSGYGVSNRGNHHHSQQREYPPAVPINYPCSDSHGPSLFDAYSAERTIKPSRNAHHRRGPILEVVSLNRSEYYEAPYERYGESRADEVAERSQRGRSHRPYDSAHSYYDQSEAHSTYCPPPGSRRRRHHRESA